MNLDFEITEAMVGHIYQSGFMSTAGNYAPTSMFYDDVAVAAYTPTPAPTPAPEDGTLFSETMSDYNADSENLAPWTAYINRFDADGNYQNGYSVSPAPNGPQISAWATGEEGSVNDDGTGYLNSYSNYDDSHHQSGIMETNLYAEFTITEEMVGDITATFVAKKPATDANACGGTNGDNGATGGTCLAFIKILNPSNNYATELFTTLDMTDISSSEWSSHIINATLATGDVGKLVQFGAQNTATNYAPTGMYYDNMNVSKATAAATADDLFISEFGEGALSGENWPKFIEIANFTGAEVSLDGYFLGRMSNGINSGANADEYEAAVTFTSGATIANGDVWVIGRADNDDNEAPQTYLDNLDQDSSGINHNGNDAYKLYKKASASDDPSQSATVIDALGDMGAGDGEAGTYWDVCGVSRGMEDVLVARKATEGGTVTTEGLTSFGTNADDCQWEVTKVTDFLTQSYDSVGSHTFTGK